MGSTSLGLIIDSSVFIDAERKGLTVESFLEELFQLLGTVKLAISSITVAELAHGIYRANNDVRRNRRRSFLNELKQAILTYPITGATGEIVGKIGGQSAANGVIIPMDDLLIGACALEHNYGVLTKNLRHFRLIPDLQVVPIQMR